MNVLSECQNQSWIKDIILVLSYNCSE